MAHQTHNIPWQALTTHLKWKSMRTTFPADLHIDLNKATPEVRTKQILYFVDEFVRNIEEHAAAERKKFPETYDAPDLDDIILSDALATKLGPAMHDMLKRSDRDMRVTYQVDDLYSGRLCRHTGQCRCAIPYDERRARAFARQYVINPCYQFFQVNARAFYNLELVKLLILHGEMDTVLRACSLPGVDLAKWHEVGRCYCEYPDLGWCRLYEIALNAYICLNVLYCFPQVWDPEQRTQGERDYRVSKCYQQMLKDCTQSRDSSEIPMLPHQQFFGIEHGQFDTGTYGNQPPYGLMSFDTFFAMNKHKREYAPHADDVLVARKTLLAKGLPMELVLGILEEADYRPKRRLTVADDPLHPENREQLAEYLKYCWQILVRCEVMHRALPENPVHPGNPEGRPRPHLPWRRALMEAVNRYGFKLCTDDE